MKGIKKEKKSKLRKAKGKIKDKGTKQIKKWGEK